MVAAWLKIKEIVGGWKPQRVEPPVSPDQKANTDVPIKISEEFIRSKRNLLWFAAACILIFLYGLQKDSAEIGSFIIDVEINRKLFSALLALYTIYIFYPFYYYGKRVKIINSSAAADFELERDDGSSILENIKLKLEKVEEFITNESNKFLTIDDEAYNTLKTETERLQLDSKDLLDRAEKGSKRIYKLNHATTSKQNEVLANNGFRQFADEISGLLGAADSSHKALEEVSQYINVYLDDARRRTLSQIDPSKINTAAEIINDLGLSFDTLSDQINGVDRRKFTYYDIGFGYFAIVTAIICTLVGFNDQWMCTISKVIKIISE